MAGIFLVIMRLAIPQEKWRIFYIIQSAIYVFVFFTLAGHGIAGEATNAMIGSDSLTRYTNESQFIVQTIVTDLAEEEFYAKHHQLPNPESFNVRVIKQSDSLTNQPIYDVEVAMESSRPPLRFQLKLSSAIWSPEVYEDAAAQLAQIIGLSAGQTTHDNDETLLSKLADGSAVTLEREDQALSKALEADFNNPALHEKAAVLLGAFALREHSGSFFDIRFPLCRMTAHLCMAQCLSGGKVFGTYGQIAQVMLLTLVNDQAAALEKLNRIEARDPALSAWTNTLYADNTYDYRRLAPAKNFTLIERIAWFTAYGQSADKDQAWNRLGIEKTSVPDFCRVAIQRGVSVGLGNEISTVAMRLELNEIAEVYNLSHPQKIDQGTLISALNETPARCFATDSQGRVHPEIIGWGQWALLLQHQLCHTISHSYKFLTEMLGLPEDAAAYEKKCNSLFGGLRLFPFAQLPDVSQREKCTRLISAEPQLVPVGCWNVVYSPSSQNGYSILPLSATGTLHANSNMATWFNPGVPQGTVYDVHARLFQLIDLQTNAIGLLRQLHERAPYDVKLTQHLISEEQLFHLTSGVDTNLFGPALSFSVGAMLAEAQSAYGNPALYEQIMTNAANLSPNLFLRLGEYFQAHNAPDKASQYYDEGDAKGAESLSVAAIASWRIDYYLNKGDKAKARQIADAAGEVYSALGLQAKAYFFEKTDDYTNAFLWFSKIQERYDNSKPLMDFCLRTRGLTVDPQFNQETDEYLSKQLSHILPAGIETVSLAEFSGQPRDGVLVKTESDLSLRMGLKKGDVIVAVNGVRVHDVNQFMYCRVDRQHPGMDLIFWNGSQYREISANPPNYRLGVDIGNLVNDELAPRIVNVFKPQIDTNNLNEADAAGNTKLLRAAKENRPFYVPDLVAAGADVKATNHQGQTVLHLALMNHVNPEGLSRILAARPNTNAKDQNGMTALHIAVTNSAEPEAVQKLIALKCDVNAQDKDGHTPLHLLALTDDSYKREKVALLLASGADPNLKDNQGRTPAHLFLSGTWPWHFAGECIGMLAKAGADLSARDGEGKTPLHYLAGLGDKHPMLFINNIGDTLSTAKVDMHAKDDRGETPLDSAAENGSFDVLEWLVTHGADLDVTNRQGMTPRQVAAHNSKIGSCLYPEVNIYRAIRLEQTDSLVKLIKACPDLLNTPQQFGMTLTAFAVHWNRTNSIAILKKYGAHE